MATPAFSASDTTGFDYRLLVRPFIGGIACGIASTITNPIDVVKIRLQNQGNAPKGTQEYKGMLQGLGKMWAEEGVAGFSRGLHASWAREITYSSARIYLYDKIRNLMVEPGTQSKDITPLTKFTAGILSGGIGSALCNPCDFIKTRQQKPIPVGHPQFNLSNWNRTLLEFKTVLAADGWAGMYKGWQVTSMRAAALTSAQLGSYDSCKNNILIKMFGMKEGIGLHLGTSIIAAVITTTASNPFDVIKTKFMCDTSGAYSGLIDCCVKTLKNEGPMAFMKGWVPAYTRVSPHTVISLMLIEQLRSVLGMAPI
jgi:hypothetical protein